MYDDIPGWHVTIHPFYYCTGLLLSVLAIILFLCLLSIKLFRIPPQTYERPLNIAHLVCCILVTILAATYAAEAIMGWYTGYGYFDVSLFGKTLSYYWILYLLVIWVPLLLTQLFWIKKYRLNVNLALLIMFLLNLNFWFEKAFIFFTTMVRDAGM